MSRCPYTGVPHSHKPKTTNSPVKIGWIIDAEKSGFIYFEPERVRSETAKIQHVKSASRCPAVLDMEARHYMIRCPFDIHIGLVKDEHGRFNIKNLAGENSAVRQSYLKKELHLVQEREWRHPNRPMIQIHAPYLFVADEPAYLTQSEPFMHYTAKAWPGMVFGGRFPTHIWPRTLMWAFEWHDINQPEVNDPSRRIKLVEAKMTKELREHTRKMASVTNYINQSISLYKIADNHKTNRFLQIKN